MNRALSLAFVLSLACVPAASQACRAYIPPEKRIQTRIADGTIVAAAIVQVTAAKHLRHAAGDMHPWRAKASFVQVLYGKRLPEKAEFERGWGSAACEWNLPRLPQHGDRWVIYFWRNQTAGLKPWLAMPLAEAKALDSGLLTRKR
jgi:hypothetical protein